MGPPLSTHVLEPLADLAAPVLGVSDRLGEVSREVRGRVVDGLRERVAKRPERDETGNEYGQYGQSPPHVGAPLQPVDGRREHNREERGYCHKRDHRAELAEQSPYRVRGADDRDACGPKCGIPGKRMSGRGISGRARVGTRRARRHVPYVPYKALAQTAAPTGENDEQRDLRGRHTGLRASVDNTRTGCDDQRGCEVADIVERLGVVWV